VGPKSFIYVLENLNPYTTVVVVVAVPEGSLSFPTIFEIIPEPRCSNSSTVYRYHGHRARVFICNTIFAAGPLGTDIMDCIYKRKAFSTAGVVKSDTKAAKSFTPPFHNNIICFLQDAVFFASDRSINNVNMQQ